MGHYQRKDHFVTTRTPEPLLSKLTLRRHGRTSNGENTMPNLELSQGFIRATNKISSNSNNQKSSVEISSERIFSARLPRTCYRIFTTKQVLRDLLQSSMERISRPWHHKTLRRIDSLSQINLRSPTANYKKKFKKI